MKARKRVLPTERGSQMVLSPIDYVIIALYFIVIVAIGFIAARFAKTKEDYLVAGRRLSFPLFFGCMAALTLGGGELVAQLCILAAEAVALLLERFDLLLALERGFFDITDDVIAVEAAEDGTLEGIFHVSPTFSFVKVMVTQTRRDDKEKSATS